MSPKLPLDSQLSARIVLPKVSQTRWHKTTSKPTWATFSYMTCLLHGVWIHLAQSHLGFCLSSTTLAKQFLLLKRRWSLLS
jgi:hypothetical protein